MTVGPGTSDAVVGMRSVDTVPVPAQLKPIASEVHVNVTHDVPFQESASAMASRRAAAASRAAVSSRIS
jgi:hypothetical protein